MKWKKFRLKTLESAEDIVISALYDCGIEGAQIEDKAPLTDAEKAQMFVDIAPMPETDDGIAWLDFYLDPEKDDVDGIMRNVRAELEKLRAYCDIGAGTLEISETEDTDWINNWKKYFKQFYIDDILVIPSWEKVREEDRDRLEKLSTTSLASCAGPSYVPRLTPYLPSAASAACKCSHKSCQSFPVRFM